MEKRDRFKKVYIEISNICNLNCPFCIKTNRDKKALSVDEFKIILDKVKPFTKYLYFHVLGEPLLHKDINELINIASKDFYINITTNGYLINNIKTKNIRQINISLHSYNDIYNKSLEEYLDDLYNYAINNNKNTYINFRLWANTKYADEIINYFNNKFNINIIKGINNKLDNNIYLNFSNEFVWPDNADKSLDIEGICYALTDHIAILSDGTITACCLDASGKINFGNIFDTDISEVLDNKLFKEMLDGFKEGKRIHPLCKKCNFLETKIKN
ncbi:MAG: radical SAM protein [Bacilli bacterium]|nr:radical SAM protein [Bacilli bacterium]